MDSRAILLQQFRPSVCLSVRHTLVLSKHLDLVVSVAQLVVRRTHDRKVVGSIPTNAVCFTVVR